ncbi:succinylglutamate desuccinylase/aspartoacylase family protein [Methanothermobacter thermautotrophicus]|nr:succinylglutamate desuccinylase/aspartoacylase family protein [Methanothermobacter thermautotrophicus]WBF05804.1 succinylglutamate desuccinylase/aspartoacylase family protein [Methanothermobacter thermautotrophicus]
MFVSEDSIEVSLIHDGSGGDITRNPALKPYIRDGYPLAIAEYCRKGTVMFSLGSGRPSVMVVAGVHGNEIPPQLAAMYLIESLAASDPSGTVHLIPIAAPWATMRNIRWCRGRDLNRSAGTPGSVTNAIFRRAIGLGVDAVADFHSTAPGSRPGVEGVFCSEEPEPESVEIARYITSRTSSRFLCYGRASSSYIGALEDECNLAGIPSVTCEVVSENGTVRKGSHERSLLQMRLFLEYMGILVEVPECL